MELHFSLRPKESLLSTLFLEVFVLDSVDWISHIKLQKLLKFEEYIKKMESELYNNRSHFESSNDEFECV